MLCEFRCFYCCFIWLLGCVVVVVLLVGFVVDLFYL